MAAVMIGVDPHKASHTAAAIGPVEEPLGQVRIQACASQVELLVAWAAAWPERTWAVEGATGLGSLLARQLVAVGERVLDVQPKLAARARLLAAGNTNKNDPNDAQSVAAATLRSAARREVRPDGHAAVLKVWSKRYGTWDGPALRSPAACTRCCATWYPAASAGRSPRARPRACWRGSPRLIPPPGPAASSPPSSWPACAASMLSGVTPVTGSPRWPAPPARR
jgi:Transposase